MLAPGGDIRIAAKDVLINAAFDTSTSSEHSKYSQVALGGSVMQWLGLGGAVGGAVKLD